MTDEIQKDGENVIELPIQAAEHDPANTPALGVHVVMMEDGGFGIQATGEPNLGEMQMLLARALMSVEARINAETIIQMQSQIASEKRIITPGH